MIRIEERIEIIEKENDLFSLRDENGLPVWDILRYDVIKKVKYHFNPQKETVPHPSVKTRIKILFKCFKPFVKSLSIGRCRFFFYIHSRQMNEDGFYFDRDAIDLVRQTPQNERIVFDASAGTLKCVYPVFELPDTFFYLIHSIRHFFTKDKLSSEVAQKICLALNDGFCEDVMSDGVLQSLYVHFISLCEMFEWLLKRTKPDKVIVSYGRYKAISYVARNYSIQSFLVQHSLIDKADATVGGTCPRKEDGANPDVILTYGSYWGGYLRHLMEVWILGNRFLYKPFKKVYDDGTIVFISSIDQGPYMADLLRIIAPHYDNREFIFKLHPGERSRKGHYIDYFRDISNISVVLMEEPLYSLLCRCSIVVLISSTTLFEALNIGKCVAIYDHPDFSDVTIFLKSVPNTYCFNNAQELEIIINSHHFIEQGISYYDNLNMTVVNKVLGL